MNPTNPHPIRTPLTRHTVFNLVKSLIACLAVFTAAALQAQQNGVWTNDANSVWSATTNWLNGTVADGTGAIADFTLDNSNFDTVTMDTSHSLGTLLFGNNATVRTNRWTVNASGGSVLTLAGGTTIAVSNGISTNTAVLSLPIAGSSGLTKVGSGTLLLGSTNGYAGNTVVSGGILKLTNSPLNIPPTDPLLYFSFDNVAGPTVVNQGTGGAGMNGTLFGGAVIVPGGRYGNALSIPGGAQGTSYVLVNNPVTALNAAGTWTVAMWVKTTTAGGCYMYQGSGGFVTGDISFYLNPASGGVGSGGHAGGVQNSGGWVGGTALVNDGNWHFLVLTDTAGNRTNYVDGIVDPLLVNQWNRNSAGTQIRIGGNSASEAAGDGVLSLNGLIDEVYIYNRAISPTEVVNLMNTSSGPNDSGSIYPIPATSPVSLAAGTRLDLNGASPQLPAVTGTGTVDTLSGGVPTLVISNSSNVQFDGLATNSAGALALLKLGSGALTLTGTNFYNGATIVDAGTLNITGAFEPTAPANTMTIDSVFNFSGTLLTNFNYIVGSSSNLSGAFYQTAGISKQSQAANGANFQLGFGPGALGYYYIGAGATNFCNEIGIGGENNPSGNGLVDVNGGTLFDSGWVVLARGANGQLPGIPQTGVLNVYPGAFMTYAGGGIQCNWGSGGAQLSVINMLGGIVSNTVANLTINLNQSGNVANTGILNLDGGIIQAGWVSGGANGTRVNFNGGTLQAAENQTVEMTGLAAATVYSRGGTINNAGFNLTIAQQFLAPSGNGVNGISSFTGGAGYIAPPIVTVVNDPSDTTGVGATAIAQINPATGTITNVLITCPGVNYTATPTFALSGGNPTTPATITGNAPTPNANTGGLTFTGSGTTTLTGGWTYGGPTTISGGSLIVTPSAVTPATPGDLVITNAAVNIASAGTTLPVGNLNLQNNSTLNIGYGTVFANPTVPVLTATGSILVGSTNIINITAFGLKPGTITLIKYGSGTLSGAAFANIGFTLPAGLVGTLVNNTGNQSIDLNITSSPNQLSWVGVAGTNWDLTTTNWLNTASSTPAVFQQYTNGGIIAGDGVTFDDTLTNDFVDPQPTNINLTGTFNPFPVFVNSTLPYSISGPGSIVGAGNMVKTNSGTLTLLTSNTFTGGFAINQGTVIVTNDFSLGTNNGTVTLNSGTLQINGNTTNNSRVFSVPATSTIDVLTNVVARFGGTVSGAGGLTKIDNGTLTLAGNNTTTGPLIVSQGTYNSLGTENLPSVVTVGNTAGVNATLSVGGGTFNALNNGGQFTSSLIAGSIAGTDGDIRLTAGTLTVFQQFGLGAGAGAYAAFNNTGGALVGGSYIVVGFNNDQAVFNQTGGSTTVQTNLMTIAAGGTGAIAVANFSGGTYLANDPTNGNPSGRGGMFVGETGIGTLNVSGSATITALGETNLTLGRTGAGSSGTVNLNGGTITTLRVLKGAGLGTFNFNGGTLKASAATPIFVQGLNNAFVYNGGAVIDDSGFAVTLPQPLLAPVGFGVSTIAVSGGSGYIDTPIVTITGGSGSNAMATAIVANGTVTAVTVTCPGSCYQPTDSLNVSFSGGGAVASPPTIGTITFVANGTGGLTKKGAGTLTLTGANTFSGPITNTAGTLALSTGSTYSGLSVNAGTVSMTTASTVTGNTTVSNSAVLTISQIGTATNTTGSLTLSGGAATPGATLSVGLTGQNSSVPFVNCGTFTVNGTNTISLAGAINLGTIPVVKYASQAGTGTVTNLLLPQGVGGFISNSVANSTLYVVITNTGPGLVWAGTNSNPALTNLWDINSTTNWLLGATPTSYHQTIIPGDAVTFNDSGAGTVILNTNAGPSSLLVSNNAVTYTFKGSGAISGPTGLNKLGAGLALINLTNSVYLGDTVVGSGTLELGSPSALSSSANLSVASPGTLELNGESPTVNALNGSGLIDNNNTTNVTLTVNTGGTWNGTIHDQGLGGGVSLTKVGNNTLVIGGTNLLNNPTASQVNAGLTIMTNNAAIGCGSSEFWVGAVGGSIATNIVDGGTLIVSNNFLVVGRGSATAIGTMIINHGTVQKAGANVVVVGSLGATGTLIMNGGQLLNNSEFWLGESPTAVANLYLNGGLLQANDIRPNNNGGVPTVTPIAFFNGGTLQATASSTSFLQVQCDVMSNGLVLDDNGFTLSIGAAALQDGDGNGGGLTKLGSGSVYLDVGNTYSGTTVVSNGLLAGVGSINGPVLVKSGGSIGAGDAGALGFLTLNSTTLTIQGKAAMRISKTGGVPSNDQISGISTATYGGLLVISNATSDPTPLANGDTFTLFSAGASIGNFAGIVGSPGPGLAYSFDPTTGVLSVVTSSGPPPAPTFGKVQLSGGNIIITATNNNGPGGTWSLLATNNVAAPLSTWPVISTGTFDSNGNLALTNAVGPGRLFYILRVP